MQRCSLTVLEPRGSPACLSDAAYRPLPALAMAAPPEVEQPLADQGAPSLHSLMSLAFPGGVHPQHASAPIASGFDPARHMTPEPGRPAPSPTRARAMSDSWAHSSYMHSFQQSPTVPQAQYPPHFQPPAAFSHEQHQPAFGHEQHQPDYGLPPPMPPMVVGPQNSPQGPPVRLFQTAHRVSMARYGAQCTRAANLTMPATSSDPRGSVPASFALSDSRSYIPVLEVRTSASILLTVAVQHWPASHHDRLGDRRRFVVTGRRS